MPKKKEEKRCQHFHEIVDKESFIVNKTCPHEYFATYIDPETCEETDYCIFHAPMELKNDEIDKFWEAFDLFIAETNKKYEDASTEEEKDDVLLECRRFIFPDTGRKIRDNYKSFLYSVDFGQAVFEGEADFSNVTFKGKSDFRDTTFREETDYTGVKFEQEANFGSVVFVKEVNFMHTQFHGFSSFIDTKFCSKTFFIGTRFLSDSRFIWAAFKGKTSFYEAVFKDSTYFEEAKIQGVLEFTQTEFIKPVSFWGIFISGELSFPETQFQKDTDFREIKMYLGDEDGSPIDPGAPPGAILFDNAFFHRPERVQIGGVNTDLGQWSFKDTNIEKVNFVYKWWKPKRRYWLVFWKRLRLYFSRRFKKGWRPDWRWRDEYEVVDLPVSILSLFRRNGRKVIYDEILANEDKDKPRDERRVRWKDAGQVYRRLRKKFEGELAYELTSDFHYGQMECRRLNSGRHFLHPDRVFAFLYKIVSGYGERFGLPLAWFAIFFGLFAAWVWNGGVLFGKGWLSDIGCSILYTLKAAFSFRTTPGVDLGLTALMHLWKLFAAIFGTFFILALRRRFKK
jgi:hypothetical protein